MSVEQQKIKPYKRHNARVLVVQALYQWLLSKSSPKDIEIQILSEQKIKKVDVLYFQKIFQGVTDNTETIDGHMKPYLDRDISKLTPIELSVLRMAIFEFLHCLDVPYRVVINEALELTKKFGAEDGFKYVNGILDKVAKSSRPHEQ